jgi:uncharacterized protein (DUF2141 family)
MIPRFLLITTLVCGIVLKVNSQTVIMTIEGIRNNKGEISLGIFRSQQEFAKEKTTIEKVFAKTDLRYGVLKIEFYLEPGNYAAAILDDENKDGEMNYNIIGIPLEGFGFSNYVSSGLRKPRYKDFSFDVKTGENRVHVKMKYIL